MMQLFYTLKNKKIYNKKHIKMKNILSYLNANFLAALENSVKRNTIKSLGTLSLNVYHLL